MGEVEKKFADLDRHTRKRIQRNMRKGLTFEEAYERETNCDECGAPFCNCGQVDLPYIAKAHYTCMHQLGKCSQKVADQMVVDEKKLRKKREESLERLDDAEHKSKNIV